MVVDGGSDAGRGGRRRLVDLPAVAAVPGNMPDECWRRMDAGISLRMGFPYRPCRGAARGVRAGHRCDGLVGVAWLTLVLGMRWQLKTKAVAALPGLATLALVGAWVDDASTRDDSSYVLWLGIEGCCRRCVARNRGVATRSFRSRCPATGGSAVGNHGLWFHPRDGGLFAMIIFSDAIGDTPPGTGYLTVATIAISAILTLIMTLRTPKRTADDEPHQDPHAGSLTLA